MHEPAARSCIEMKANCVNEEIRDTAAAVEGGVAEAEAATPYLIHHASR